METLNWVVPYVWEIVREDIFWVGRTVVAGAIAAVIGIEREQAGKAAGVRTHMLVGIAACTFASVGNMVSGETNQFRFDPLRAVAAVATGIGFLGGGIIFVTDRRDHVRGLTTAASIWATSAIAVTVAFGHYVFAISMAIILFCVLRWIKFFSVRTDDFNSDESQPPPGDAADTKD